MVWFPSLGLEENRVDGVVAHRFACACPSDAIDYAHRKQSPPRGSIVANPEALVFVLLHLRLPGLFPIGASLQVLRWTLRASTVV
jgi:hypothetical protein